jgi:hypothetical protein
MDSAVKEYADDFGHDLDEEGQPLEDGSDSDGVAGGGSGESDASSDGDEAGASDDGEQSDASKTEQEAAPA